MSTTHHPCSQKSTSKCGNDLQACCTLHAEASAQSWVDGTGLHETRTVSSNQVLTHEEGADADGAKAPNDERECGQLQRRIIELLQRSKQDDGHLRQPSHQAEEHSAIQNAAQEIRVARNYHSKSLL